MKIILATKSWGVGRQFRDGRPMENDRGKFPRTAIKKHVRVCSTTRGEMMNCQEPFLTPDIFCMASCTFNKAAAATAEQ